ncbi:hypothetical protein PAAG_11214 [Paracoccidioides lutzii Pb01]|uniref:Uncharacterized protein n=1 Tax=Paracoccidioides lutzii (strain ATCC MYA-826 / Pb01) TaxID=502779 RepID=A0A0A2V3H0_PARBA|nr:hypothetical protein PAAG_11214 [Paracoccidioides lutzii Pb01]KGQ02038.1 hypothetical protein PAAG_11214 [Paracoccidioides lutzii Pb01]
MAVVVVVVVEEEEDNVDVGLLVVVLAQVLVQLGTVPAEDNIPEENIVLGGAPGLAGEPDREGLHYIATEHQEGLGRKEGSHSQQESAAAEGHLDDCKVNL